MGILQSQEAIREHSTEDAEAVKITDDSQKNITSENKSSGLRRRSFWRDSPDVETSSQPRTRFRLDAELNPEVIEVNEEEDLGDTQDIPNIQVLESIHSKEDMESGARDAEKLNYDE